MLKLDSSPLSCCWVRQEEGVVVVGEENDEDEDEDEWYMVLRNVLNGLLLSLGLGLVY